MRLCVVLSFFLISHAVISQYNINGRIVDEEDAGIPFANVILLSLTDSVFVKGSITDTDGYYTITNVYPGNFIIRASMVGYMHSFSNMITLSGNSVSINDLVLIESSTELEAVVVEAEKPLYEQKIDRMVVNVESSPIMAGNSVLEILEKSPGVIVNRQNEEIILNGKRGVNVMINGKMNRMNVSTLFSMLDAMPSANIEKIELISTPPASFDAEGNAGFINIVLKSNENDGLNCSVTGFAAQRRRRAFGAGGTINYRKNDINVFADINLSDIGFNRFGEYTSIIHNNEYVFDLTGYADRDIGMTVGSARFGIDYYLSPTTVIGALGTTFRRDWRNSVLAESYYDINPGIDTLVDGRIIEKNLISQYMANVNFQHNFNEKQQLNIDLDYFAFYQDQPLNYLNRFIPENGQMMVPQEIRMGKTTPLNIWVGKFDYKLDLSEKVFLEVGVKTTINKLENEVVTEQLEDDTWLVDEFFSDYTLMDENIVAGFSSFNLTFGNGVSAKAGLRYEHTITDLRDNSGQQLVYRNYGNFFPTAFLQSKLTENSSINLAYNYRISRPTFSELAPFVLLADPRTFFTGNTQLFPALSHSLKMAYSIKGINVSFEYNYIKNSIARFQANRISDSDVTLYSAINLDNTNLCNLTMSLPLSVSQWWEMSYNLSGVLNRIKSKYYDDYIDISTFWFNINTIQSFTLPWKFSVQLSALYFSKSLWGVASRHPYGMVSFGLRKEFKRNRGALNLNLTDIFRTNILHWTIEPHQGFYNDIRLDADIKCIQLTYTNSFGNNKFKSRSKRQTGAAEDLKRL